MIILMILMMITMMMVQMLLEDKRRDEVGLLVDWLELLDPTIISSCPELQMKLVFGNSKVCSHDCFYTQIFLHENIFFFHKNIFCRTVVTAAGRTCALC